MTARVLLVDDAISHLRLLEARLAAEYFDVTACCNGQDALRVCADGQCDIVLLDVMMPGLNGLEVCRRLKADPATAHLPVVMVSALSQPADRLAGLEAGADDFLPKPVDATVLTARLRSLARLRLSTEDLRKRSRHAAQLGINGPLAAANDAGGRVLIVDDGRSSGAALAAALAAANAVSLEPDPANALVAAAAGGHDLFVVSLNLASDGLRLCSQLRALAGAGHVPILAVAEADQRALMLRGLELGVNDCLLRPFQPGELSARARTLLRRKRDADGLRQTVEASMEMAVVDVLTGLFNRRYFDGALPALLAEAQRKRRPLALMMFDIDHFKSVNDVHGHAAGDQLLQALSARIRSLVRSADIFCRLSGDEFVIVMPDTPLDVALRTGERIRAAIAGERFRLAAAKKPLPASISAGLAVGGDAADLLRRADAGLYRSKQAGRNRVSVDSPHSEPGAAPHRFEPLGARRAR